MNNSFNVNDEVRIIYGLYNNYKGIVKKVNNIDKTILVEILMNEKNIIKEFKFNEVLNLEYI